MWLLTKSDYISLNPCLYPASRILLFSLTPKTINPFLKVPGRISDAQSPGVGMYG